MNKLIIAALLALASTAAQACKLNVDCPSLNSAPASGDLFPIEHIADPTKKQITASNLFSGLLPLTLAADTTVATAGSALHVGQGGYLTSPGTGGASLSVDPSGDFFVRAASIVGGTNDKSVGTFDVNNGGANFCAQNFTNDANIFVGSPQYSGCFYALAKSAGYGLGQYVIDIEGGGPTKYGSFYLNINEAGNGSEWNLVGDVLKLDGEIVLPDYLSTRDNTGTSTPVNFLYTDSSGNMKAGALNSSVTRTALGLAIGTNVQAYDADLTTYAGTTPGTGVMTALGTNVGSSGAVLVKGTSVCADLSNGATGCSTATGTSGATIPLLNGTNTWSGVQTHTIDDSGTNTVVTVEEVGHTSTGTAASGLGASLDFALENASGTKIVSNQIQSVWSSTPTAGAEDPDLLVMGRRDGGSLTEYARFRARQGNFSAGDFCAADPSTVGTPFCLTVGNAGILKITNSAASAGIVVGSHSWYNALQGVVGWSSTGTTTPTSTIDAALARNAAGVIRCRDDTAASIRCLLGGGADVASASALPVPTGRVFHVTGTTNIDSITSTNFEAGTCITMIFDGVLTVGDGNNLKLTAAFVTTADDTLSLCYDGTNWFETARSVN